MRVHLVLALLAFLASTAHAEEQKRLVILNATPYELLEVHVWYAPPEARLIPYRDDAIEQDQVEASGMAPQASVVAYVAADACLLQLSAIGEGGHLFSARIDICRSMPVWIIRSSSPL